ncbi:hypothetical protein AGMMS4957_13050 [Bacteroidia bacterium]|nr:hypothetical protein AGMMS4957_13050 [Bacteroidia bacterium]
MNLNLPLPVGTLLWYYGAVFISLLAVYAVGWVIKALFVKIKEPVSAFSILTCSVLGLTFIVTIYSLIMTKGLTVNWMLVALALLYVYYYRKNGKTSAVVSHIQPHSTSVWKYVCILLTINALFFCYFMSLIIDFGHGMFQKYHFDFDYYAKLSQYLNLGYENGYYLVYNFAKYIPPTPYHYFELWTNAIIYKAFGLNAVVSYMVSLPLFFTSLIFLAFLAIIEIRKKPTFVYILLAFVLLLMVDIIPYLHSLFPIIRGGAGGVFFPKLQPVFLFSITAMLCFLSQKRTEAYFLLLAIPVINLLPIIGVWGTIGVLLLWDIYRNHKIRWQYWTPYLVVGLDNIQ